jgi:hypothetical protein
VTLPRKGGAGLELNAADPRHRERLPADLSTLPPHGLVNLPEAEAVVHVLEGLTDHLRGQPAGRPAVGVAALYPAQAELIRRLAARSPRLAGLLDRVEVIGPAGLAGREWPVALVSLTRSHTHRAVSFGDGPRVLARALTRARARLVLVGDPGTLGRRCQWDGAVDHLEGADALRERDLVQHLVNYLQGQGPHLRTFHLHEGSRA